MLRRLCLALLIALPLASAWTDAEACGDKFLRAGRSARFRQYASVHPSPILVYAPRWTPTGIKTFETMLRRAGHAPATVTDGAALSRAVASTRYEMVIVSYAHAGAVEEHLQASASKPAVLPVLYKPSKRQDAEASATYAFVLRPEKMTRFEALEEIDRAIGRRLKSMGAAGGR